MHMVCCSFTVEHGASIFVPSCFSFQMENISSSWLRQRLMTLTGYLCLRRNCKYIFMCLITFVVATFCSKPLRLINLWILTEPSCICLLCHTIRLTQNVNVFYILLAYFLALGKATLLILPGGQIACQTKQEYTEKPTMFGQFLARKYSSHKNMVQIVLT